MTTSEPPILASNFNDEALDFCFGGRISDLLDAARSRRCGDHGRRVGP